MEPKELPAYSPSPTSSEDLERRQFFIQAAGVGVWEIKLDTRELVWDSTCLSLFGLSKGNSLPLDDAMKYIHPDDIDAVREAVERALRGEDGGKYDIRYRTLGAEDGKLRWVHFSGHAYFDEKGNATRFGGIAQDITELETAFRKSADDLRRQEAKFQDVTNSAPTGLWLSNEEGGLTYLNKTLVEWTGMSHEALLGAGWANAIIEEDRAKSAEIFLRSVSGRTHYDTLFRIKKGNGAVTWCRAAGDPFYREDGSYAGYAGFCMDVDELITGRGALYQSETRFRNIFEQAPMGIGLLTGRNMVVELGNDIIFEIWGKDRSAISGLALIDALPEIKGQGFIELLEGVFDTGEPFFGSGTLVKLARNGVLEDVYVNFTYTPLKNTDGTISGVMVLATEVTAQVLARQSIEASEAKLRSVIAAAPAAMGLFVGKDLVVEMPNQAFLDIVGKGPEIAGKPLRQAMPELENQPILDILDEVYASGKRYQSYGTRVDIMHQGQLMNNFFNIMYTPLLNEKGEVYAILNISSEVTEEIQARRKIEEAEAFLRGAVDLAELGTWSIDLASRRVTYSEKMIAWAGFSPNDGDYMDASPEMDDDDRVRIEAAIIKALTPASNGIFNEEYTVINRLNGKKTILHAQGRALFNEQGIPIKMVGTARDITAQRKLQLALEQEIRQRTMALDASNEQLQISNEELAATNEELAAANEEMIASNEELSELNEALVSSNDDLQQFAHVASHDLKEPLRKIKTFISRIEEDHENILSGKSVSFIGKMNVAADRMFSMIDGVLSYSTINAGEQTVAPVDLNVIMNSITQDLEILIAQKNATIRYDKMPTVEGAAILLYQLFYNLIINSLKFSSSDRAPVISFRSSNLLQHKIPFTRIDVQDNGIGFDQDQAEKIFNTFTRLHAKDKYEGTGLGLSLCKKIVQRHGGSIEADGKKDMGAIFSIFLPLNQPHPHI